MKGARRERGSFQAQQRKEEEEVENSQRPRLSLACPLKKKKRNRSLFARFFLCLYQRTFHRADHSSMEFNKPIPQR